MFRWDLLGLHLHLDPLFLMDQQYHLHRGRHFHRLLRFLRVNLMDLLCLVVRLFRSALQGLGFLEVLMSHLVLGFLADRKCHSVLAHHWHLLSPMDLQLHLVKRLLTGQPFLMAPLFL